MPGVVAVAVSGGRDSLALLHATAQQAALLGLEVVALHVHHGLQPQADHWAEQLERTCARWARSRGWLLRFVLHRLQGRPARGESIEAWARQGRYQALATMARAEGASLVLLAHHRRDQAETVLLQALRGAGPAGLAAMPRAVEREGIVWARPWLDQSREAVEHYGRQHRLRHADDPSNHDPRFARNRLRAEVMPGLVAAFADAESALADVARRAAEAQAVLDEVACADLSTVSDGDSLQLAPWEALPAARRRFALRAWLLGRTGIGPAHSLLDRLMTELPRPGPASWPCGAVLLRRYRGRLGLDAEPRDVVPPAPRLLRIDRPGHWSFDEGRLQVRPVAQGGVPLALLKTCELRARQGAERFQRAPGTPPRSLKKQFQAAGLPAWQRGAPLLFSGDRLIFVPGLGLDARVCAEPGEPRVTLDWLPGAAGTDTDPR